jgi:hypothetical protein
MDGARSTHGTEVRTKFLSENLKGRDHSKDIDVNGVVILECTLKK